MPEPVFPGDGKTVLVIDDSPSVCLAILRMLRPHGYRVQTASSGQQAFESLETDVPHLILCDMLLEDLPGVEICQRLRSMERWQQVPVLLISGQATSEMELQAAGAGADGLLRKPFQAHALLERVEGLLRSGGDPDGPRKREAPGQAERLLDRLEGLAGLRSWSWEPEKGRGKRRRGGPEEGVFRPEALLADLRRIATACGLGALEVVSLHGSEGETVLLGEREGEGTLSLRLASPVRLGQARHLARSFLRALPFHATRRPPRKEIL